MGQTLTHGVYLPDEGERNCYSGLAANWQLLDGAVGTIAEHTSALAGKAPLVHTHTKSDITDFPVYGTTAGTICEGNDSRLSDARTPVAHTHGKADITDLFNSANTWSAWQTIERTNYEPLLRLRRTDLTIGEAASNQNIGTLTFAGSDDLNFGLIGSRDFSGGDTQLILLTRQKYDANNNRSTDGTQKETRIEIGINTPNNKYFRPNSNGDTNLGTSTNKWKTLNGINPGALSLPKIVASESRTLDRTNWDYTGTTWNTLDTSAMTGWGYIYIENCGATDYILIRRGATNYSRPTQSANPILANDGKYYLYITFPIVQNTSVYALIKTSGTVKTSVVYPCQGNV